MAAYIPTMINGVSHHLFASNMGVNYATNTTENNQQLQALAKAAGVTLMRCAIPTGSSDSYIKQVAAACANIGCDMFVILGHQDTTYNKHVVSTLGTFCNLYEVSNEPDLNGISVPQYLTLWNQTYTDVHALNPNAALIGPVLGVWGHVQDYLMPFLQGCKASGNIPDVLSVHNYPCTGQPDQTACLNLAASIGAMAQELNTISTSIVGQPIYVGVTEWGPDASLHVQPYTTTPAFNQAWIPQVFASLVQNRVVIACHFDFAGGDAYGGDDMANTNTLQPNASYGPFAAAVKFYVGGTTPMPPTPTPIPIPIPAPVPVPPVTPPPPGAPSVTVLNSSTSPHEVTLQVTWPS